MTCSPAFVVSVFRCPGQALLQLDLDDEKKQKLQDVLSSLNENERGVEAEVPADSAAAAFLLTGLSFLFTWNVGVLEDPDAEWQNFLSWRARQAVGQFKGVRFSATMEESLHSETPDRVHIHEQSEMCARLNRVSAEVFAYPTLAGHLVRPNCSANYLEAVGNSSADTASRGRGAAYRAACDRAHFYVQANKFGTLFTETDWPLHKNFRVQAKWFDDLVARGKLSRDQWLQYAYDTTIGFSSRKRNFEALDTFEKAKAIEVDARELRQRIAAECPKKPWRAELLEAAKAHVLG